MDWKRIIRENKPPQYRFSHFYVSLRNDGVDWNGFDFEAKDLPSFYDGERYLYLHILKNRGHGDELQDTVIIDLTKYR